MRNNAFNLSENFHYIFSNDAKAEIRHGFGTSKIRHYLYLLHILINLNANRFIDIAISQKAKVVSRVKKDSYSCPIFL